MGNRPYDLLHKSATRQGVNLIAASRSYVDSAAQFRNERTNEELSRLYETEEKTLWRHMFAFESFREKLLGFVPRGDGLPVVSSSMTTEEFVAAATIFRRFDIGRNGLRSAVWAAQSVPVMSQRTADFVDRITKSFARVQKIRNDFMCANLLLPLTYMKSKSQSDENMQDLLQEANLGLLRAIDSYDYNVGKFSTYAVWWIRVYVQRAMTFRSVVEVPHRTVERLTSLHVRLPRYHAMYGRLPLAEEIASDLGLSVKDAQDLLDLYVTINVKSVHNGAQSNNLRPVSIEEIPGLHDVEKKIIDEDLCRAISDVFDVVLTEREAKVLRLRFGIGCDREHHLAEIGKIIGITRERTRQVEAVAFRKLRVALESKDRELF